MSAKQHPRETKSGLNVSRECRIHSLEAKEVKSATLREYMITYGIDNVSGKARTYSSKSGKSTPKNLPKSRRQRYPKKMLPSYAFLPSTGAIFDVSAPVVAHYIDDRPRSQPHVNISHLKAVDLVVGRTAAVVLILETVEVVGDGGDDAAVEAIHFSVLNHKVDSLHITQP